jgi:hypothetical protein
MALVKDYSYDVWRCEDYSYDVARRRYDNSNSNEYNSEKQEVTTAVGAKQQETTTEYSSFKY